MPTFEGVDTNIRLDIGFEVFCGECGTGLCNESSTRKSRNRGYAQVEVNPCPDCMEKKDQEIEELKKIIEALESEIEDLKV